MAAHPRNLLCPFLPLTDSSKLGVTPLAFVVTVFILSSLIFLETFFFFGLSITANDAQGLFLALCPGVTLGRLRESQGCQRLKLGWLRTRQALCLLSYLSNLLKLFLKNNFRFTIQLRRSSNSPYIPCPYSWIASPIININTQ